MLPKLKALHRKAVPLQATLGEGVNNGIPDFNIGINESSDESNLDSREYPSMSVRLPRSNYADALTANLYHLGKHENTYITAVDGNTWKYWNGTAWVTILTGLAGAYNAESIDFMDKVILVNGTDNKYWDGSTSSGDVATMPDCDFLAVHDNRIYAASKINNALSFSSLRIYNDWTTANDAGEQYVDTEDGEFASGLASFADHIVYFKKHSMHELYGSGPLDYSFQTISEQIGCLSHRSIIEIKGILYWLGKEGIYAYGGGTVPGIISDPNVEGTFENVDFANADKACAGTDGKIYYINLPMIGGTYLTITYDTEERLWHIQDTVQFSQFVYFNYKMYGLATSTKIVQLMIDEDGTEVVSWNKETMRFLLDSPSLKKHLAYIYVLFSLPTASTFKIAISTEDGTYIDAKTYTADADLQNIRIPIPVSSAHFCDWYKLKFYGTGPCTIHRVEMELRAKGSEYSRG
jgi:hypothetical protein